jgi:NitT/TauT family transport system permease protein
MLRTTRRDTEDERESPDSVASDDVAERNVDMRWTPSLGSILSGARSVVLPLMGLAGLILVWQCAILVFDLPPYQLPTPLSVLEALGENSALIGHAQYTASAILLGLSISVVLGVLFGAVLAASRALSSIFMPLLVVTQALPKVAIAPLMLVWLGLGFTNEVVMSASMALFPILLNTAVGLNSVPVELRQLARSAGGGRARAFVKIDIRCALPSIIAGTKVGATLAVAGAIVGEFVASNNGLGYYLLLKSSTGQTAVVFADLIVLSGVTLAFYFAIDIINFLFHPHERRRS